jgi:long-chain acyl-CoA synthetase
MAVSDRCYSPMHSTGTQTREQRVSQTQGSQNGSGQTPTMVTKLQKWALLAPDKPALHGGEPGNLTTWTWSEYRDLVRSAGTALIGLGVAPGEAVAIIGNNRPEWLIADVGVIAAGAVPAPIYVTNTAEQVAWVANHCEAKVVIADTADQYRKLVQERANLPRVRKVIVIDDVDDRDPEWTLSWQEFLSLGELGDAKALDARIDGAQPDDLTLLCYTSGTTGEPKGVEVTHRGWNAVLDSVRAEFPFTDLQERSVSYLPLCHIAEHAMTLGLQTNSGAEVFMCDDVAKVREFLPVARPTVFLAVPRVWEKFEAALRARLGEATGVKAKLADWALATEFSGFQSDIAAGKRTGGLQRALANRLVISKVKDALGLDQVWVCISGSAPMNPHTADFFASLCLPIHDVYGMTETTAVISVAPKDVPRSGTVGKPISCVEVRIAPDGEVLAKGPNMTPGYFKSPQQTAELLDDEGWLHTGDVGHLDDEGFLRITDRKKDLFKTSGGKYVAPQMLEAKLKAIRGVGQAVAVGDGQKYISALLTIDPEIAETLAADLGVPFNGDVAALAVDQRLVDYMNEQVAGVNEGLARFEQIKKIAVLPDELSIEAGELTPTMKLKRKVIKVNHADAISSLYVDAVPA